LDPHDVYVLSSLGMAIPDNVKTTDLDMDQRLSQAESFDQQVLAVTAEFQITAEGLTYGGRHYTQAQAQTLRDNLNSGAYLSLGRIATLRQQYPEAIAAFQKAIAFQPQLPEQAQSYYQIGVAQAGAKNVTAARAAFARARQLAPKSELLQKMVQIAEDKLSDGGL
jgi:tetratricopeptide (TPR) repeat protein